MTNPYYTPSGTPQTGSQGSSAAIRAELASIAAGFDLLPPLTANKAVVVNAGGTALGVTTGSLALAGDFATTGAYSTSFTQSANVTLALPGANGTLATLAGAEAFTNKTSYNKVAITAPATGATLTIADGKTLTASNTLTFTGDDSASVDFGAGGTVLYSGGSYVSSLSGTTNQIDVSAGTGDITLSLSSTLVAPGTLEVTGHVTFEGVTSTGATGTGKFVFGTSPTLGGTVTGPDAGTWTSAGFNNIVAVGVGRNAPSTAGVAAEFSTTNTNGTTIDVYTSGTLVVSVGSAKFRISGASALDSMMYANGANDLYFVNNGTNVLGRFQASNSHLLIRNASDYGPVSFKGDDGTTAALDAKTTDGVSTVAATIFVANEESMVLVSGANSSNARFLDIVLCGYNGTPTTVASHTSFGAPASRTYSMSDSDLQLAMGSGTYSIRVGVLQLPQVSTP